MELHKEFNLKAFQSLTLCKTKLVIGKRTGHKEQPMMAKMMTQSCLDGVITERRRKSQERPILGSLIQMLSPHRKVLHLLRLPPVKKCLMKALELEV